MYENGCSPGVILLGSEPLIASKRGWQDDSLCPCRLVLVKRIPWLSPILYWKIVAEFMFNEFPLVGAELKAEWISCRGYHVFMRQVSIHRAVWVCLIGDIPKLDAGVDWRQV